MENCSVTKFKGTVDNDSLLKVGEGRILVRAINPSLLADPRQQALGIHVVAPTTITVTKNGYFSTSPDLSNPLTSVTITPEMYTYVMYVPNDNFEILISNKRNVSKIETSSDFFTNSVYNLLGINLSDLYCAENLGVLNLKNAFGNISILKNSVPLYILALDYTNVSGDISALGSRTNLQTLNLRGTSITGDIASLSALVGLTSFCADGTNLYGNADTFLDALAASGRTTDLLLLIEPSKVQLTGSTPDKIEYTVHFSGNSWSLA